MKIIHLFILLFSFLVNNLFAQEDSTLIDSSILDNVETTLSNDSAGTYPASEDSILINVHSGLDTIKTKALLDSVKLIDILGIDSIPIHNQEEFNIIKTEMDSIKLDSTINLEANIRLKEPHTRTDSSIIYTSQQKYIKPIDTLLNTITTPFPYDSVKSDQPYSIDSSLFKNPIDTILSKDTSRVLAKTVIQDSMTNNINIPITIDSTFHSDSSKTTPINILKTDSVISKPNLIKPQSKDSIILDSIILQHPVNIEDTSNIVSPITKPAIIIPPIPTVGLNLDSLLGIKKEFSSLKVTFQLTVLDSNTLQPITAQIKFISLGRNGKNYAGQSRCNTQGKFKTKFTNKSHFIIRVTSTGYKPFTKEFFLEQEEIINQKFEFICKIEKFKVGDRIKLDAVYFDQNQYQLLKKSTSQLDELVELMRQNPKLQIQLNGHTDFGGDIKKNLELSLNRVKSVRFHLIQGGIKLNRIKVKGFGGTQPASNKRDKNSRMENRRVEFQVLKI